MKRLREIIDNQINELVRPSLDDYDYGWAYRQAHHNGQLSSLMMLRKLVSD